VDAVPLFGFADGVRRAPAVTPQHGGKGLERVILDGLRTDSLGREPSEPGQVGQIRRFLGRLAEGSAVGSWWRPTGEPLEARVQKVVAAQLGVGTEELTPDVSLSDDLAADSLDLVELGFAFEDELGINLPERVLQGIRTYGDLLHAIRLRDRERRVAEAGAEGSREPAFVWVRIVGAPHHANGDLLRGGWLTPYTAETIVADALRNGPGSRVEISVPTMSATRGSRSCASSSPGSRPVASG